MKSLRPIYLSLALLLVVAQGPVMAQCAMCKATVESNIENNNGKTVGRGLNSGIMYLMSIPYIVLGGIGFMVYRNWKGKSE